MSADRIEIRGLRALGHHGANPGEQDAAQPFEIDLDVELDESAAKTSDDLGDTVDYGEIALRVAQVIETERFALLEALGERLAQMVLATPGVRGVELVVRKLRPPVPVELDTVGVHLRRTRAPH